MDPARSERLGDDLRGLVRGSVRTDPVTLALYGRDASPFHQRPLAVVSPRDEADVAAAVKYAHEQAVPVIARGGGTNRAGATLGPGIVIDFSRYMTAVVEVGNEFVRVQPGVTVAQLNRHLAGQGRAIAAEPFQPATCTMGGLIAGDRGGPATADVGYPGESLLSGRVVLDTGIAVDLATEERPERLAEIRGRVLKLFERDAKAIATPRPRIGRVGYHVQGCSLDGGIDFPRLLAGSEGTLALFTELTLRTVPVPPERVGVLLGFTALDTALALLPEIRSRRPTVCDLYEQRLLTLVRNRDDDLADLIPAGIGAVLVVEFSGVQARTRADSLLDRLTRAVRRPDLTVDGPLSRIRRLSAEAFPSASGLHGTPPVTGIDDIAVPPESIPTFLSRLQDLLQRRETTAAFVVNVALGRVSVRPFLNPADPADAGRLWALAEDMYAAVLDHGGVIGSTDCVGLARTPWVARQSPALAATFRELKSIFDPAGILNPGKIVGPDPRRPAWPMPQQVVSSALVPLLIWSPGEARGQVLSCSGCGDCRTAEPAARMCPIFHADADEAATPRAKVTLAHRLLEGADLDADAVRAVADLCVHCRMCASECPSRVNVSKLVLEAKAQHVAKHGMTRHTWALARIDAFARIASRVAPMANIVLDQPSLRWLLEKSLGIDRHRRLPPFARRNLFRRSHHWGWDRPPSRTTERRVAYFADTFAAYHDPTIGEATVRVLQHQGFGVYVPPGQTSSGSAPLVQGDVDTARECARQNLRILGPLVREGYAIVCSEPTAALALKHDYPDLLDDPDARLVAEHTHELTTLLDREHQSGRLNLDFQPIELSLGHHVPCHVKALGPAAGPGLLALIPQMSVRTIDVGCSGMAGTFGLAAVNDETSRAAGRATLDEFRRPGVQFGSTECGSCRMQIEDAADRRTLHPVQYLALAYGLMPKLAERLRGVPSGLLLR